MTDLDVRLKKTLREYAYHRLGSMVQGQEDNAIKELKQAFIDDGWVTPENKLKVSELVQKMTDLHTQTLNELTRLKLTPTPIQSNMLTKEAWEAQAIKDGWVKVHKATEMPDVQSLGMAIQLQQGYMTGQEWYDAYKRELGFGSFDDIKSMANGEYLKGVQVAEMKCDEAAKRASGLEKRL